MLMKQQFVKFNKCQEDPIHVPSYIIGNLHILLMKIFLEISIVMQKSSRLDMHIFI